MFLHDIPPVGSQDGLKINPLLIRGSKKEPSLSFAILAAPWKIFFFFFKERNASVMNRLKKK